MEAKIIQAIATLQEQIQMKTVEKGENADEVTIADFSYSEYPQDGFLKRVSYGNGDTYIFDLNYIDRINKDMKKNLVGGEGVNGSITLFRNVYGINKDFTVWYIDEDGKMYGASEIIEMPLNVNDKLNVSDGLKELLGLKDVTVGDVRGKTKLELNGDLMTDINKITDLEELSFFPNLTELTLTNLNLKNIDGLQYCPNLNKIWFDNTKPENYDGLKYCLNVTGFYLINNSVTESNILDITNEFTNMSKLDAVRIRNNTELRTIPSLKTLGPIRTLYIEENENLTNIYGLSTVENKTSLINLYLNENNLTDVVTNGDKDETYNYVIPQIQDGNVINMSYIDGYGRLETLNCGVVGESWGSKYEDGKTEIIKGKNNQLKYLLGFQNGKKVGINNLKKLKYVSFEYCDILKELSVFQEMSNQVLKEIYFKENKNIDVKQIVSLSELFLNSTYSLDTKYTLALSSQLPSLTLKGEDYESLEFLNGNIVTTSLKIQDNSKLKNADMQFIGEMVQLKSLLLSKLNSVTDFSFLKSLPNLESLTINNSNVRDEDLKNLSCKDKIKRVELVNCWNLTDPSIYGEFPNLGKGVRIRLEGWKISNYDFLENWSDSNRPLFCTGVGIDLTKLQKAISRANQDYGLYLGSDTKLLSQLSDCENISFLRMCCGDEKATGVCMREGSFGDEGVLDLNSNLLKEVIFSLTGIKDLNLEKCKNLEKITINNMFCGKRWVPCDLSKNTSLESLILRNNCMVDEDLVNLLNDLKPVLEGNEVVSGAPSIEEINFSGNNFVSLKPFENFIGQTSTYTLNVSGNNLVDLNGIENLVKMTELDIQNNVAITNITPILTLKEKSGNNLTKVYIKGCNQITTEQKNQMKERGITVVE